MKPILFNTEMVRAILEGRKTVTRRVVKLPSNIKSQRDGFYTLYAEGTCYENQHIEELEQYLRQPYKVGDVLYVRETWNEVTNGYVYKATNEPVMVNGYKISLRWRPSIHMPKAAARIFLKVTDVRVERLRDITDPEAEGIKVYPTLNDPEETYYKKRVAFKELWDSTIRKDQYKYYCWDANPYVWVI